MKFYGKELTPVKLCKITNFILGRFWHDTSSLSISKYLKKNSKYFWRKFEIFFFEKSFKNLDYTFNFSIFG